MGLGPEQQRGESRGRGLRSAGRWGRGAPGAATCPRLLRTLFQGHRLLPTPPPGSGKAPAPATFVLCVQHLTYPGANRRTRSEGPVLPERLPGENARQRTQAGCEDMAGPRAPAPESTTSGRCSLCCFVNKIQTKEGCLPSRGRREPQGAQRPFCVARTPGRGPFPSSGSRGGLLDLLPLRVEVLKVCV